MPHKAVAIWLVLVLSLLLGGCATTGGGSGTNSNATESKSEKGARVHTQLGQRYLERGNLEEALEKLKIALQYDPLYAPAHTVIAVLYQRIGNYAEAEKHYRRAAELAPDKGMVNNNLGQFLCSSGKFDESLKYFRQAQKDPFYKTPEAAYINAGSCLMNAGRPDEAAKELGKALEIKPSDPEALYQMASALAAQGKYFRASAFIQRFDALDRPSPAALALGYKIETGLGDTDAAREYAKRLRDEFPESAQARNLSGDN